MKQTKRKINFRKQVISTLNAQAICGEKRAVQSNQALIGCCANCQPKKCLTA